ncbi:MAG: hypothetical protein KDK41_15640 [Leptospiraceae bacterium]|nr:hypothetical protein [Leptospiraceae bacterium]
MSNNGQINLRERMNLLRDRYANETTDGIEDEVSQLELLIPQLQEKESEVKNAFHDFLEKAKRIGGILASVSKKDRARLIRWVNRKYGIGKSQCYKYQTIYENWANIENFQQERSIEITSINGALALMNAEETFPEDSVNSEESEGSPEEGENDERQVSNSGFIQANRAYFSSGRSFIQRASNRVELQNFIDGISSLKS